MQSTTSKLNSTFGTMGNATADKMSAKVGEVFGNNPNPNSTPNPNHNHNNNNRQQ